MSCYRPFEAVAWLRPRTIYVSMKVSFFQSEGSMILVCTYSLDAVGWVKSEAGLALKRERHQTNGWPRKPYVESVPRKDLIPI